jgi:hypothetical protein
VDGSVHDADVRADALLAPVRSVEELQLIAALCQKRQVPAVLTLLDMGFA